MRRSLFIGVIVVAAQREATAQCRVPAGSNEGKLLAFYTAPIVFTMAIAPEELSPGSIRIGAEGNTSPNQIPPLSERAGASPRRVNTLRSLQYSDVPGSRSAAHSVLRSRLPTFPPLRLREQRRTFSASQYHRLTISRSVPSRMERPLCSARMAHLETSKGRSPALDLSCSRRHPQARAMGPVPQRTPSIPTCSGLTSLRGLLREAAGYRSTVAPAQTGSILISRLGLHLRGVPP